MALIAAENIHFGSWCLSSYPPEQRGRILPVLRELAGLLALLVSFYFAARIYLAVYEARSHGPLLPADWLDHVSRMDLEGLAALVVVCALIIYR